VTGQLLCRCKVTPAPLSRNHFGLFAAPHPNGSFENTQRACSERHGSTWIIDAPSQGHGEPIFSRMTAFRLVNQQGQAVHAPAPCALHTDQSSKLPAWGHGQMEASYVPIGWSSLHYSTTILSVTEDFREAQV